MEDIEKITMKQTVEEAAYVYATNKTKFRKDVLKEVDSDNYVSRKSDCMEDFIAGAEWQAKQSPWTLVGDRSNPAPSNKPCLLLLEDGSVVEDDSNWEDKCLLVVAWMLKPSFDQILQANKDVRQ